MMESQKQYVRSDEHGVMRVGDTRVSLDSIVYAYLNNESPEFIRQGFPVLSLEEVYGAIAYFLGHRMEVEAYLERQARDAAAWKAKLEAEGISDPRWKEKLLQRLEAGTR